jgi:hypothetical protein
VDTILHGTDGQLELYALGRLGESEAASLEGHLLVCDICRQRLDEAEAFSVSIREALRMDPPPAEALSRDWFAWLRQPRFALAAALAVIVIGAIVFSYNRISFAPPASIQLTALRGEMATAPPTGEIDLTLTDAPSDGKPFRLEVVDSSGGPIWSGTGTEARIHRRFRPGVYFVRLYSARADLLREYGFVVKK